jgi:hypothetical protein
MILRSQNDGADLERSPEGQTAFLCLNFLHIFPDQYLASASGRVTASRCHPSTWSAINNPAKTKKAE